MSYTPEVCRAWREHQWEHVQTERVVQGRRRLLVVLKECRRCGTTKRVHVARATGKRVKAPYKHPKGYRDLPHGSKALLKLLEGSVR